MKLNYIFKNKLFIFFLLGSFSCFLWLNPVFNEPQLQIDLNFTQRFFRTIYLLLLLPFIFVKLFNLLYNKSLLSLLSILLLVPLLTTTIIALNITFIITSVTPIVFTFFGILILSSLNFEQLKYWLFGISFISLLYLIVGIYNFGFTPTTYFGRPRVHFGFTHPIQTASAILATFLPILFYNTIKKLNFILIILMILLLILAQSFNILLSTFLFFIFQFIINIKNKYRNIIFYTISFLILFSPFILLIINLFPSDYAFILDIFTSGRISHFTESLKYEFVNDNIINILFGPMLDVRELTKYSNSIKGFGYIDSVYLSYLFSFGIVGLFFLYSFFIVLIYNIYKKNTTFLPYFLSVLFFFTADSQGFTPNNLIIFVLFVISIRSCIYKLNTFESKFIL